MIVSGQTVSDWVSAKLDVPPYEKAEAIGIMSEGRIVAGVVFWNYNGHDVEVSVAKEPNALVHRLLKSVGDYVWRQLNCARISVTTQDAKIAELAFRLGGVLEGIKRDCYGEGRNGYSIGILRNAWRFSHGNAKGSRSL